jgi:hypothetical protein
MTEIIKPKVKILGGNANINAIVGICSRLMNATGQSEKAKEMKNRVLLSHCFDEAIEIMQEYCEIG